MARRPFETWCAVGLVGTAAVLSGLAYTEHARATTPPVVPSEIRVLGEAVDATTPEATAAGIAAAWARAPLTLVVGETRIESTRGALGGSLDEAALAAILARAADGESLLRRHHAHLAGAAPLELPVEVRLDGSAVTALLLDAKEHIDVRAESARIRPRTGEVVPEVEGRALDVSASLEALEAAMERGATEAHALVASETPTRTARDLEGVRTEALLGFFETRYSTLEESADRTSNLRLGVSRIDGIVVMPGETFHFNDVVGPRTEANGFRPAPEIAGGELALGVGGGTCQVAGTLHAAVFFAGLDITSRRPHSRPSAYLWMGLDATVSYPDIDFQFTNDQPFAVVLGFTMEAGVMRAEIRGARTTTMVSFTRRIDETVAFAERDEPDPSLPLGVRVMRQRGVPGFRITWFRTLRDLATNQAVRERGEDVYPPTDQIWRVGSGAPAPADYVAPEGDAHLPYTADSYLVASEGPGLDGVVTTRR